MSRQRPLTDQIENIKVSSDVMTLMRWVDYDNLNCRQVAVIFMVEDNPGCSTGAIATALKTNKPSITRAVDKLVKLKLLKRVKDPQDNRLVKIYVTEKVK